MKKALSDNKGKAIDEIKTTDEKNRALRSDQRHLAFWTPPLPQLQDREIFQSNYWHNLPELPPVGTKDGSAVSHTIVIEAVRDLMTDYHANAAVVQRLSLAFAEERRLEDPGWEHWNGDRRAMPNIQWLEAICEVLSGVLSAGDDLPIWFLLDE